MTCRHPHPRNARYRSGFTLIEMSVALLIIAFILGGGITIAVGSVERAPFKLTVERFKVIEKALLDYRRAFNRLPCPAFYQYAAVTAQFGFEEKAVSGTAECATVGVAGFQVNAADNVMSGILPVRTLGLPDSYAADGWGRKMTYTVDSRLTLTNAFATYTISDTSAPSIRVLDAGGSPKTTNAGYVIVSHGKSGDGSWSALSKTLYSNNAAKQENCECTYDVSGVATINNVDRDYYQIDLDEFGTSQVPPFTGYDDIVVFKTRGQLRSRDE